ncbi:MAG: hypothetical protein MI974_11735 [Chitinophagales bacterium]|nr:hypothetical protein [Chitinophagales bacterium]
MMGKPELAHVHLAIQTLLIFLRFPLSNVTEKQSQDITFHQSPITNHQSPITNHQSPITNHPSPFARRS